MNYDYYKLCPKCKKRTIKDEEELCWHCKPQKHQHNEKYAEDDFIALLNKKKRRKNVHK